jgi:hypothetical protein
VRGAIADVADAEIMVLELMCYGAGCDVRIAEVRMRGLRFFP